MSMPAWAAGLALVLAVFSQAVLGRDVVHEHEPRPRLTLVIDDLGQNPARDRRVLELPGPLWSSPVVVDDVLIQTDCEGGINAFDLSGGGRPTELWSIQVGGCLESTPAVWDGWIYVGSRDGSFYAVTDCATAPGQSCVTAD